MGSTDGGDDWHRIFSIIAVFHCSFCVISAIRAIVGLTVIFDGELSAWVEGVGYVDINEKDGIMDGPASGGLGEIVLVIRRPIWRHSHAALEENRVKSNTSYPNSIHSCMNIIRLSLVVIEYWFVIVGTFNDKTRRMPVSDAVACASGRSLRTVG